MARTFTVAALELTLLTAVPGSSAAQLRLAPLFSDGMVLQRHAAVPVWGWADPGDTVVATFDRHTYTTAPDTGGRWVVTLPPLPASGPYELTVAGRHEQLHVRDILVGDVWLCAGQSNMEFVVADAQNATQEIAAAHDVQIRHFKVPHSWAAEPAADLAGGGWAVADSEHVGSFTAVGYFFALALRKTVAVPIGLLNTSWGATPIESWMSRRALRVGAAEVPTINSPSEVPTLLFNKMVHPLLPYPIKGVLWYQGESNAFRGGDLAYRELFAALIKDWRRAWGIGDFPFLFVQLPNYMPADTAPAPNSSWAVLRESQSAALELPNTAQVVTIDIGEANDIHPRNKQDVGARLALAARRVAYGERHLVTSGPRYRRHVIRDGRVVLEFEDVGHGLVIGRQGGPLQGFAIAGADQRFVWATAVIDHDRVVVWSDGVPKPVAVRYAWGSNPDRANLYNQDGLPAAPFRTDRWAEGRDDLVQ